MKSFNNLKQLLSTTGLVALTVVAGSATAQELSDNTVKIGVLTDMSSLYSDSTGAGSVLAAQMAIDDFGGQVLGRKIELISADHQNKADVAALTARNWWETQKVDVIVDLPGSAPAEAVKEVGRELKKIDFITGAGSSALSNKGCSPYSVHWNYDTYSNANTIGPELVKRGFKTWYFITADYSFGHQLQADTTAAVEAAGGKVVGSVRHPANSSDFSSFVAQAQASGAKMIGLANTGADALNSLKSMRELGVLETGQSVEVAVGDSNVYQALGLDTAKGILTVIAAYWDLNDETRAFSKRFFEKQRMMPQQTHMGTYTAVQHYLQALKAAGTDNSDKVMEAIREIPIRNMLWKEGKVRIDGRAIHEMYLWEGKKPEESKGEWDVLKLVATVSADKAFRPLEQSECALVRK